MAELSINLVPLKRANVAKRILWNALTVVGLLEIAFIIYIRFVHMCPMFGLKGFDFMFLSAVVNGLAPHLFYRVTHNLTHPILLIAYAAVFIHLSVRFITNPPPAKSTKFLFSGTAVTILALLCSHVASCLLPVGDLV